MILKALYDYYHRSQQSIPFGFEAKEIGYIIVLDKEGEVVRIEDTFEKGRAKSFIVPQAVKRSSNKAANLLWDSPEYVLALPKALKKNQETEEALAKNQRDALAKQALFKERCIDAARKLPQETIMQSISLFYQKGNDRRLREVEWAPDAGRKDTSNISFQLQGELEIAPCRPEVTSLIGGTDNSDGPQGICLITGKRGPIVRLTTSTPILGSKSNATLVAYQVSSGYDSYGKSQCFNAPISIEGESAYTSALKTLMSKDSRNKFILAGRTFIFWASSQSEAATKSEESFFNLMQFSSNKEPDNPNKDIASVQKTFKSIWSGILPSSQNERFFILGLAPNSARIAVVMWYEGSLREFAGNILRHFEDMEIVDTRKDPKPYQGAFSILSSIALERKVENNPPNLAEALVKSIFQSSPYPISLYNACLRRIRADVKNDSRINTGRTAILKAYLNRTLTPDETKISIMLDKDNSNTGYLCGRLFAVLDKIQEDTSSAHTIRERYMNSASATPAAVFSTLLNLSNHHMEKLSKGSQVWYEKLKQEIIEKIGADGFPAHLNLRDQGRFFIGYYHQRQDFFTSKKEENEN